MKSGSDTEHSDRSPKPPRRLKSREVSSRYLSPTYHLSSPERSFDNFPSPKQTLSPIKHKPTSSNYHTSRRQRSIGGSSDDDGGLVRGRLRPPPTPTRTSSSSSSKKKLDSFGDYPGKGRLKDLRIENNKKVNNHIENPLFEFEMTAGKKIEKENNHKSFFGGSMKLGFSRRSSSSNTPASNKPSYYSPSLSGYDQIGIAPGRLSVDETAFRRRSLGPASDTADSESEYSDVSSSYRSGFTKRNPSLGSHMNSAARRSGVEVSSKYLQDLRAKTLVGTPEYSKVPTMSSLDIKSPKRFSKSASMTVGNGGGGGPKWASSPGRESLPPISMENKGKPPPPFSNLRPKGKGVGDLLSKGLGLFRGNNKKSAAAVGVGGGGESDHDQLRFNERNAAVGVVGGGGAAVGTGVRESVHQLRSKPTAAAGVAAGGGAAVGTGAGESVHELLLMHNRLIQWRFVNARAGIVNLGFGNQAESNFIGALNSITKLQHSVVQKKLRLDKEKLDMKLNFILHSQIKSLEAWGNIEAQNLSAVSRTKDSFHSAICRVPLVDGAKMMDPHSAFLALQHAADLATSINSMLYTMSPVAEKTKTLISELAAVLTQEKALLHEFLELLSIISRLETQERSLKCNLIQIKQWQQQQQNHQQEQTASGFLFFFDHARRSQEFSLL